MLYALLVSEFGERKPQLTARIGHTLMKDRRVLSAYGLNLPVRPASKFIGSALALSFSYQAAPIYRTVRTALLHTAALSAETPGNCLLSFIRRIFLYSFLHSRKAFL